MDTRDIIVTALTPGSAFNVNGMIWRSVNSLSVYTGLTPEETLELLAGDLGNDVSVRPSQAGKGLLVALKELVPQAANQGQDEQIAVAGGPAFNGPVDPLVEAAEQPQEEVVAEGPFPDAPEPEPF